MKTIIFHLALIITMASICNSQITQDYPFKTHLDSENNLYVAGNRFNTATNSIDIIVEKYLGDDNLWSRYFPNPFGDDRGLDLAVDAHGNTYVTGYVYSDVTNRNDIILIKYNSEGIFQWDSVYYKAGDDKGLGIDLTLNISGEAFEIFVSGYVSSTASGKDFIIRKHNVNGVLLWQDTQILTPNDDVATDIIVDDLYAYVVGYSYQGDVNKDDITFLCYKLDGELKDKLVHYIPYSSERPSEFSLAEFEDGPPPPLSKSRSTVGGISDGMVHGQLYRSYITVFYGLDVNNNVNIRWSKKFTNGTLSRNNVATTLAVDDSNNVYVSGYTYNAAGNLFQENGFDFTTIKYTAVSGNYAWSNRVLMYNHNDSSTTGIDDRASSIKVNESKDVYVAGMSDGSPNGFSMVQYKQPQGLPIKNLDMVFNPSFVENNRETIPMNKWATIELAADGTPLLIVMAWDESNAYWAARKYDANGNIEYTIDPFQTDNLSYQTDNVSSENPNKFKLEQNYPNPFNPVTKINYELPITNYVTLKVYNVLGKEIASLVNEKQNAGSYSVDFDGSNFASGIYFYKIVVDSPKESLTFGEAGEFSAVKRMILIK